MKDKAVILIIILYGVLLLLIGFGSGVIYHQYYWSRIAGEEMSILFKRQWNDKVFNNTSAQEIDNKIQIWRDPNDPASDETIIIPEDPNEIPTELFLMMNGCEDEILDNIFESNEEDKNE